MENVITLGNLIGLLFLFFSILCLKTPKIQGRNELARPVPIFLVLFKVSTTQILLDVFFGCFWRGGGGGGGLICYAVVH